MKRYFLKAFGTMAFLSVISCFSFAQENKESNKINENEEIIIRKKGDKDTKFTVEIRNGEIKINGKPLSEFKDENVSIIKEGDRIIVDNGRRSFSLSTAPRSPFRRGDDLYISGDQKGAYLGVMTDEDERGAKITAVTKGSAAEKAGLKVGDIITKVNETEIKDPHQLTVSIAGLKAEDKAAITFRRDKKEEKVTAVLGNRSSSMAYTSSELAMNDFNFNMDNFGKDGINFPFAKGRFGIKAQDTEEGKGVKVLEVQDESNAEKAGIEEGDIIQEFDGKIVNSATELAEVAKEAKEKSTVKVKLSRDGKSRDLEIKIPKKLKTTNL